MHVSAGLRRLDDLGVAAVVARVRLAGRRFQGSFHYGARSIREGVYVSQPLNRVLATLSLWTV